MKGFSTKGDRRGMGLAIVKELIGEYAAIFLETEFDQWKIYAELSYLERKEDR